MPFHTNEERIFDLVDHLSRDTLARAPKTHFPVQLPLSFPTSLHHINFLTILHLVRATLSHARHTSYFAETISTTPHDTALRGVMGLFLASDETWTATNLLSGKAWKGGIMTPEKISEFFGLETMKEKDHPSMPMRVGERWKPGVDLAGDLAGLFRRLGDRLPMRCVGEAVLAALRHAGEEVKGMRGNSRASQYARVFCDKVIEFERSLADQYPAPEGIASADCIVMPAAPLRLLQDLSALLPELPDLAITIPSVHDLSHISPLPLPLPLIVHLGLISTEESASDNADARAIQAVSKHESPLDTTLLSLGSSSEPDTSDVVNVVRVSSSGYAALQTLSVEVCREIWGAARFSRSNGDEGEWKHELSFLHVERMFDQLAQSGQQGEPRIRLAVNGDA